MVQVTAQNFATYLLYSVAGVLLYIFIGVILFIYVVPLCKTEDSALKKLDIKETKQNQPRVSAMNLNGRSHSDEVVSKFSLFGTEKGVISPIIPEITSRSSLSSFDSITRKSSAKSAKQNATATIEL
jgi:hypothetical protein